MLQTLKRTRQELLFAPEFNLCYWSWCVLSLRNLFIRGLISGNHNQPCIFSLSTQGRLFNPHPEGDVVIVLVCVCVLCMCVHIYVCGPCVPVCCKSYSTASRLLEGKSAPWTEPDETPQGAASMCNTSTSGGYTGETNWLITATLSRTGQVQWEVE